MPRTSCRPSSLGAMAVAGTTDDQYTCAHAVTCGGAMWPDPAPQDDASVDGAVLAMPGVHGIGVLNGALAERVVARAVAGTLGDVRHERTVAAPSIAIHRGVVAAIHRSRRTGRLASFVGRRAVCTFDRVWTCPHRRMEGMTIHRCRGGARRKRRTDTADPCRRMYAGGRGD